MRFSQFRAAIEQHEPVPRGLTHSGVNAWWKNYLNIEGAGSGRHFNYTTRHVRLVVAWVRWKRLTGSGQSVARPAWGLVLDAARLTADVDTGWVYVSAHRIGWSPTPPTHLLPYGVAAVPAIREDPPLTRGPSTRGAGRATRGL